MACASAENKEARWMSQLFDHLATLVAFSRWPQRFFTGMHLGCRAATSAELLATLALRNAVPLAAWAEIVVWE